MRTYPDMTDEYAREEVERLAPKSWMLESLKLNPSYTSWGPHEDYMWVKGQDEGGEGGWNSRVLRKTWSEGRLELDELNEVVSFYFSVERDNESCSTCGESGYNSETKRIADMFYRHSSPTGIGWDDKITQDEVLALVDANRLFDFTHTFVAGEGWKRREDGYIPTAEEVNAWQRHPTGWGHDAVTRGILIKVRAKRLGVWGHCSRCDGHGYVYTSPTCRLALTLWVLHPRKGCSRGWEIASIEEQELPDVYRFLADAAKRNAERFAKVVALAQ